MGEGPRLCAICDDPADDAFLCGDCDEQIHGANWLARKHQRMVVSHRGSPRRDLEGTGKADEGLERIGEQGVGSGSVPTCETRFTRSAPPTSGGSLEAIIMERDRWRAGNVLPGISSGQLQSNCKSDAFRTNITDGEISAGLVAEAREPMHRDIAAGAWVALSV
jgi:hypothetical protein